MATQGLRGQGFSPVSPLPFAQARERNELMAEQILQQKQDRLAMMKEKEKREKDADKLLKEEFDKHVTEAELLGLGKGRARAMSLGQIKGWVAGKRAIQANEIDRLNIEAKKLKNEESRELKKKNKKAQEDKEIANKIINHPDFQIQAPLKSARKIAGKDINLGTIQELLNISKKVQGSKGPGVEQIEVPGTGGKMNVGRFPTPTGTGYQPLPADMQPNYQAPTAPPPRTMQNIKNFMVDTDDDGVNDHYLEPDGSLKSIRGNVSGSTGSGGYTLPPGSKRFDEQGKMVADNPRGMTGAITEEEIPLLKEEIRELEEMQLNPPYPEEMKNDQLAKMDFREMLKERLKRKTDQLNSYRGTTPGGDTPPPDPAPTQDFEKYITRNPNGTFKGVTNSYRQEIESLMNPADGNRKAYERKNELLREMFEAGILSFEEAQELMVSDPAPFQQQ